MDESTDYKQSTINALKCGAETLAGLCAQLPNAEGQEPDCVKNARNWFAMAAQTLQDGVKELEG